MGEGLRAMDKNKDGKISKDEYTGPAPLFDRLDRNSDGFISSDELPGGRPGGARARRLDAHRLLDGLGRPLADWSIPRMHINPEFSRFPALVDRVAIQVSETLGGA